MDQKWTHDLVFWISELWSCTQNKGMFDNLSEKEYGQSFEEDISEQRASVNNQDFSDYLAVLTGKVIAWRRNKVMVELATLTSPFVVIALSCLHWLRTPAAKKELSSYMEKVLSIRVCKQFHSLILDSDALRINLHYAWHSQPTLKTLLSMHGDFTCN